MNVQSQNKALMGALPLLAQALGRKFGVKVVMGGDTARTDGDTITLPLLPIDDPDTSILATGYLDHECGHVRATDFEEYGQETKPLNSHMLNVFEDIRVEKLMGEIYPGCRTNLAVLVKKLVASGDFKEVNESNPGSIVSGYLLFGLRSRILGQTGLDELAKDAADKMDATYPGLRAELDRATSNIGTADSTAACREITAKVIEAMKKYIQEPPEPPQQPDQKPQGESSSLQGDGESQGPAGGDEGDEDTPQDAEGGGQGDGDDSQEQQSSGDQAQSSKDGQGETGDGGSEQGNDDKQNQTAQGAAGGQGWEEEQAKTLEQALDATEDDLAKNLGELLKEKLDSASEEVRGPVGGGGCGSIDPAPERHVHTFALDANRVRTATNALRVRITSLLQSSKECRRLPRRRGRQLDSRKVVRLSAGIDQKVFRGRDRKTGLNTAVHILVDRSGSMDGTRIEVANDCLLAVKLALECQKGVNLGLSYFPAAGGYGPILRHGEKHRSNEVGVTAGGGTPLAEALWGVAAQMQPFKEDRKVIIVLTDGNPAEEELVHKSIKSLEQNGYELIGMGIQHPGVINFFRNHEVIHSVAELPKALFNQLESLLVS